MIVAHTDEIGLIIKRIDSKAFLWFDTIGGINPQNLFGKHVIIKTNKGYIDRIVHNVKPGRLEGITEVTRLEDFFIEIGAENKKKLL
ncbi:hypothetical protein psyc5s11_23300 [Clostridium gelidum]|uniref:Uncharacterized protein n=1 Tax=Clostridium gelidum TaxID=704125 RepID=A0ABM7T2X8_9CLOT|nr:hypothetical protein psyc5s11_23300 [Clostridium gelidum]